MGSGSLEIVESWVHALSRGDVEGALALCDPSVRLIEAEALMGSIKAIGIADVRHYLERFPTHWSEVAWTPVETREAGEHVAMRARLKLRGRRSGIEVDREWVYVFTVRDGKLVSQVGFDDWAEGLRAAGITGPPD